MLMDLSTITAVSVLARHATFGPPRPTWDLKTHLGIALLREYLPRKIANLQSIEGIRSLRETMRALNQRPCPPGVNILRNVPVQEQYRTMARNILPKVGLAPTPEVAAEDEAADLTKETSSLTGDWIWWSKAAKAAPAAGSPAPLHADFSIRDRVILYLHGGDYMMGSSEEYHSMTANLAREADARVYVPNYRLSPESPFPAALEDAYAAYMQLLADPHINPSKVIIAGDGAGGGLALGLLLLLRDSGSPMPAGTAVWSPLLDLTHSQPSYEENAPYDYIPEIRDALRARSDPHAPPLWPSGHYYCQGSLDPKHPYASPMWATDLSNLGPILIQCGDAERLRDESIRFAQHAAATSGRGGASPVQLEVYEDMPHDWHFFEHMPLSDIAFTRTGRFIQRMTRRKLAVEEGEWFVSATDGVRPRVCRPLYK